VHATPHDLENGESEDELGNGQYVGMPLFAEIGPLALDPKMKREVEQSFKQITEE